MSLVKSDIPSNNILHGTAFYCMSIEIMLEYKLEEYASTYDNHVRSGIMDFTDIVDTLRIDYDDIASVSILEYAIDTASYPLDTDEEDLENLTRVTGFAIDDQYYRRIVNTCRSRILSAITTIEKNINITESLYEFDYIFGGWLQQDIAINKYTAVILYDTMWTQVEQTDY